MNCEFCQKPTHIWFDCPNKPAGWRPARLAKKSTAARKDVPFKGQEARGGDELVTTSQSTGTLERSRATHGAGTQALPVDTNGESPNGRAADFESGSVGSTPASPSRFDKKAWMREYMRDHRKGIRRRRSVNAKV